MRGGYIDGRILHYAGLRGYYWSNTARSNTDAYFLRFTSSINPQYSNERRYGFPLRCLGYKQVALLLPIITVAL